MNPLNVNVSLFARKDVDVQMAEAEYNRQIYVAPCLKNCQQFRKRVHFWLARNQDRDLECCKIVVNERCKGFGHLFKIGRKWTTHVSLKKNNLFIFVTLLSFKTMQAEMEGNANTSGVSPRCEMRVQTVHGFPSHQLASSARVEKSLHTSIDF